MSHDGVPAGQKIPLKIVPHEIAQPRFARGGVIHGPLPGDSVLTYIRPGDYVLPRNVVLELGKGVVTLGNGESFEIAAGSIEVTLS